MSCPEGKIDETPLYKSLSVVSAVLAHSIIQAMPAYLKAAW